MLAKFLLIMLPFTFIQFFYAPWLEAQTKARAPRELHEGTHGHVILTRTDPITMNLIQRLKQYQYEYVIITEDIKHALELFDQDDKVVVGDLTDPETYWRLRVDRAALVVANIDDMMNTNILLKPDDVLMLAEGLNVFRADIHASLVGKSLVESQIRMQTGCSVIAINQDGKMVSNPDPSVRLSEKDELIMIGTDDAENRFLKRYPEETKTKVV